MLTTEQRNILHEMVRKGATASVLLPDGLALDAWPVAWVKGTEDAIEYIDAGEDGRLHIQPVEKATVDDMDLILDIPDGRLTFSPFWNDADREIAQAARKRELRQGFWHPEGGVRYAGG